MEMVSKQDVLNIIHSEGGCDAKDEYTRGWDEACNSLYNLVRDMEAVKEIPVLSPCPFCGGKVYLHDNEGYNFGMDVAKKANIFPMFCQTKNWKARRTHGQNVIIVDACRDCIKAPKKRLWHGIDAMYVNSNQRVLKRACGYRKLLECVRRENI